MSRQAEGHPFTPGHEALNSFYRMGVTLGGWPELDAGNGGDYSCGISPDSPTEASCCHRAQPDEQYPGQRLEGALRRLAPGTEM